MSPICESRRAVSQGCGRSKGNWATVSYSVEEVVSERAKDLGEEVQDFAQSRVERGEDALEDGADSRNIADDALSLADDISNGLEKSLDLLIGVTLGDSALLQGKTAEEAVEGLWQALDSRGDLFQKRLDGAIDNVVSEAADILNHRGEAVEHLGNDVGDIVKIDGHVPE